MFYTVYIYHISYIIYIYICKSILCNNVFVTVYVYINIPYHSWQRGPNPPYFIKTLFPPYIVYLPSFLKFCPTSPPTSLLSPTPSPTAHSVALFLWLNGWSRHIWCAILLNIMDVHMSSLRTLMRVLCNKASSFIVCIGVSTSPLLQKHHPLFFAKPYLKSILAFRENPPKKLLHF